MRTLTFRKNYFLERLLFELNSDLQPSETKLIAQYQQTISTKFPLILIMGPLRSGTTLLMQWLANTGLVAYPTNLLSRFYQAPIIGAKIQLLLTDHRYNFRNELEEFSELVRYQSENGKTKGVLAPNEFWYFWRRFLAEPTRDIWSDEELKQSMDTQTLLAELSGIMDVFQKPFAAKGMLFNYNIPFLNSIFDEVIFIQMKRDLVANVASVLEARKRQLGSEDQWYSFKIPEYEQLKKLDPTEQAVGQVYYNNLSVTKGLINIEEKRKIVINHEEFCNNPAMFFEMIQDVLYINDAKYTGPKKFKISRNSIKSKKIEDAIFRFEAQISRRSN
jgi:hypothetical protein